MLRFVSTLRLCFSAHMVCEESLRTLLGDHTHHKAVCIAGQPRSGTRFKGKGGRVCVGGNGPKQSEPRTAGHLAYAGYGTATAALFVGAAFSAPAAPVASPVLSGGSTDKRDDREGPGPRRPPTGLADHIECIGALGNHP